MTDFEKYADFDSTVDRLGFEAASVKNTAEYPARFRKLTDYFLRGYYFYLLRKYDISGDEYLSLSSEKTKPDIRNKLEKVDRAFDYATDKNSRGEYRFISLLRNKTMTFNAAEVIGEELPFFRFLSPDLFFGAKKEARKADFEEKYHGMSNIISEKDMEILRKFLAFKESVEDAFVGDIVAFAEKQGISEKKLRNLLDDSLNASGVSLDCLRTDINGRESTLADYVPDERAENAFYEAEQKIRDADDYLEELNRIYRESFMEIHKKVFPPFLTNELITAEVREYRKTPMTDKQTIEKYWDMLRIEDQRRYYADGRYLCIALWVFDRFTVLRRCILNAELAEELGMSPSNFSKKVTDARNIIRNNAILKN